MHAAPASKKKKALKLVIQTGNQGNRGKKNGSTRGNQLLQAEKCPSCMRVGGIITTSGLRARWLSDTQKGSRKGFFCEPNDFFEGMTFFGGQIDSFSARIEIPLGLRRIGFGSPGVFFEC